MHVVHVIVDLDVGGAESMLNRLIRSDPSALHRTAVISLTSIGEIGSTLRARGIPVHALGISSILNLPVGMLRLIRLIRKYRPDIVQTWMYHADLLGGLAARLAGCRNVVWGVRRTSLSSNNALSTRAVMKICALLSGLVPRKIVCVAEAAKQAHVGNGYCANRMVVIPNGFEFSLLTATAVQRVTFREAWQVSEGDIVIGSVGRFHLDKGQDLFVKAAAIVSHTMPTVKFMLAGRGCDENNAELLSWLQIADIRDRFILLGERNDVPICLAAMDIFCLHSRTEGFPNGLSEAMAMGLPSVATNVGDVQILAGGTVLLVPPEDAQALAASLLNVLAFTKEQQAEIGRCAKVRITSEFQIEKARERFEALYRTVMQDA